MMQIFQFDTTTQEYVEAIHSLQKKHKVARVKDIAALRGVTMSSVSIAINLLKDKNLIKHEQYGLVELTEQGEELGCLLDQRHQAIKIFLKNVLGVDEKIAEKDACNLEHIVSSETIEKLMKFLKSSEKKLQNLYQINQE